MVGQQKKPELTLEPPSGFEPGALDWESSALTTMLMGRCMLNVNVQFL